MGLPPHPHRAFTNPTAQTRVPNARPRTRVTPPRSLQPNCTPILAHHAPNPLPSTCDQPPLTQAPNMSSSKEKESSVGSPAQSAACSGNNHTEHSVQSLVMKMKKGVPFGTPFGAVFTLYACPDVRQDTQAILVRSDEPAARRRPHAQPSKKQPLEGRQSEQLSKRSDASPRIARARS